jgi:hypothetical protein
MYDATFRLLGKQYVNICPYSTKRLLLFRTTLAVLTSFPTYKYPMSA